MKRLKTGKEDNVEWEKYFQSWSCGEFHTNCFWETLGMKGCLKMLTLLTAKCGFRLSYHPSATWFLHILQTSSRQIRARPTRLGLIGHALFCPQILSGRKGESQDFLHLNVGVLGAQWPSWKYCVAMILRLPNVQKPQTFPWHLYRSAAQLAVESSTSKRCQSTY